MIPESELGAKIARLQEIKASGEVKVIGEIKATRKQVDIKLPYKTETQENLVYKLIDSNTFTDPVKKSFKKEPTTDF